MRYLLFAVLAAFTFSSIADTPEETDATPGLPIWLLYQATLAAAACVPPGTEITDSNFNEAITDWFASGDASQYGDITKWCTGAVTDMFEAFKNKGFFDADISGWDTSEVTNMAYMFRNAGDFNQDIGRWNTSNVTNMQAMFESTDAFNQDIGSWSTGNVTNMEAMFESAEAFNRDIGRWNTSNVTNMSYMFRGIRGSFNQDIGSWNTGNVTDMAYMFADNRVFNQDLSSWTANPEFCGSSFAEGADAWADFYGGSVASTPPLGTNMLDAGCTNG
jgi:surface protein